jgi:hypothetical protein
MDGRWPQPGVLRVLKDKSGHSLALQASRKRDGCALTLGLAWWVAEYVNFIELASGDR